MDDERITEDAVLLDELATEPPAPPGPSWGAELRIVSELPQTPVQAEIQAEIPAQDTAYLLRRISTAYNPVTLWALHAELDARGIPPCLRPDQQIDTEQARFVSVLADLLWLAKRHPGHRTLTKRVRRILNGEPNVIAWHKAALWTYQLALGQPYTLAKWLALTPEQRHLTATMPTRDQAIKRNALPDQLTKIHNKLLDHARAHPDRSGTTEPCELAKRRTELLRVFLLLDRDRKRTHRYMQEVAGFKSSINALNLQLQTIAAITGSQRLVMGSTSRVRRFRDSICSSEGGTT